MIAYRSSAGPVGFAFTDRAGGTSAAPFDQFNLALHVGDDPVAVKKNRALLAMEVGVPAERMVFMNQVHGADVAVVTGPWTEDTPPAVDAMVTATPGLALAVLVADCVPVLLADPDAGVVGVAHAGRPGLAAGVIPAVVEVMRDTGARHIVARIGPAVCGACYEVPESMRADVARVVPEAWATTRDGTPALDVPAGVMAQLGRLGVNAEAAGQCTIENPGFFSYRRDRATGRFGGVIWREP